jgi:hypothetical protein
MSKLASLLAVGLLLAVPAQASVTVTVNTEQRQFDTNPRLSEVLQPYALQQPWYWPAATLYRTDSTKPELLRQQLLQLLDAMAQQATQQELQQALASLRAQLLSWQLAERIVLPLDYDAVRVRAELNPRLDSGHYLIQLKPRPQAVHVSGAVQQARSVVHRGVTPVADYLTDIGVLAAADSSKVVVVQADGRVISAGIAYWNRHLVEAMPGAQILLLFAEPITDNRFAQLNSMLQQLALHRILP